LGKIISRTEFIDIHHAILSRTQEEALVGLINKFTYKDLLPTPRMVRNLAEEIRGQFVEKN